jgi:hypothetical protein
MSDPIHDFLDSPDGVSPSLLDQWLAEDLPEDEHLALVAQVLGSPRLRELATAALAARAGLAERHPPLAVVGPRVAGLVRVVRSTLRPLPTPAVAVRSGAAARAASERFSLEPLARGAHLRIAADGDGYRRSI